MTHENNPSETVNSIFAQRFYQLFKSKNITQDTLASYLGVSRQMIALYYKDKSVPSYEILIKIADYFDVTTDYLLGRTDDPSPKPSVADELGLSERTVENLKELHQDTEHLQNRIGALNVLLSSLKLKILLDDIDQYLLLAQDYCDIDEENYGILQKYAPGKNMIKGSTRIARFFPPDVQPIYCKNVEKLKEIEELSKYRLFRLYVTLSNIMENYSSILGYKIERYK